MVFNATRGHSVIRGHFLRTVSYLGDRFHCIYYMNPWWNVLTSKPWFACIWCNGPHAPKTISIYFNYSKTCLQGTLWWEDNLWSGDTFSKRCPIFPMLRNLWRRDTCHVGTLSLGYRGVPWRQVLLYWHLLCFHMFFSSYIWAGWVCVMNIVGLTGSSSMFSSFWGCLGLH